MTVWSCHATITLLVKDENLFFMLLRNKIYWAKGYYCQVWACCYPEAGTLTTVLINSLLRWALSCNKLSSLAAFLFFLGTAELRHQSKAEESKFYCPIFVLTCVTSVLASQSSSNNSALRCWRSACASCHPRCIACTWSPEIWDLQLHLKQENQVHTLACSLQAVSNKSQIEHD